MERRVLSIRCRKAELFGIHQTQNEGAISKLLIVSSSLSLSALLTAS